MQMTRLFEIYDPNRKFDGLILRHKSGFYKNQFFRDQR